jgi:hypothetical protein
MQQEKAVGSVRLWEVVVAVLFLIFGAIVVWDSRRLGAQWGSDGPQAGYFPFYIGVFICVASAMNLIQGIAKGSRDAFVEWGQLRLILIVLVPTLVYVALIDNPWYSLGIYVPSMVFIAFFMRFLGKYGWAKIAAVTLGTMVAFFVMFEIWFKVPLPKGPIEAAFGFA